MNVREAGFLLLTCRFGNPERKVLTPHQVRTLAERMQNMPAPEEDRDLEISDLTALGYGYESACRILGLLEETELLEAYLRRGSRMDCVSVSRVSGQYPSVLKSALGWEAPGCLWAKGDLSILEAPKVALVGSREIRQENREFAAEVGRQAAKQGYVLVSGNARGADRIAQNACLRAGGRVISVVADSLAQKSLQDRVLYISEDDFDSDFSAQRALSRNRVIHALGEKTFVAQTDLEKGGTWDGTVKNLRVGYSPVFCFEDGSAGATALVQLGANGIGPADLRDISGLQPRQFTLL